MKRQTKTTRVTIIRAAAVAAAVIWIAGDVAWAADGRTASTRSSASSSSSNSSSNSASRGSTGSRSSSSSRSAVSRRSATSRSGGARSSSGAGLTRQHHDSRSSRSFGGSNGSHSTGHHRSGHSSYGRYGYGHRYSSYWHPYWGYFGLSHYGGYGAYSHGYGRYGGYGHYPVRYSSHRGYRMGALDLKVRPKNTEVYVDGQYVGLARQYDGFPGHLWLDRSDYEISFYKPGYETQTRQVRILTDLILDLEIDMLEGEAVKPELQFDPERGDGAYNEGGEGEEVVEIGQRRRHQSGAQGRLHVAIEPGSALVFLDGNELGTGSELSGLHAGLIVSAGRHRLEIVESGYETIERELLIEPGGAVEIALALEPTARAEL